MFGNVTTRVIQSEQAWDEIQDDWNALHAASVMASPPLDFDWLRSWWRVYKSTLSSASLRVITVWRGATLIGALPLYVHGGQLDLQHLRFISTGEAEFEETCPDYLNLLTRPGEEVCCARTAWTEIARMRWDHAEFLNLDARSPLLGAHVRSVPRGVCPVADLSGGFEAYLQRLSANGRQQARRVLRDGERAGARFEIIAPRQIASAVADLINLHQERWTRDGQPGVFAARRFIEFHRGLVGAWLPSSRAILARLFLDAEPIAVLYGFVTGSKFHFYQSGIQIDPAGLLRSPGTLAHLLLMKALSEHGVTTYDFLRGSSDNKKRLATGENQLANIELWRPTPRVATWRAARLLARLTNAGFRLVRRAGHPPASRVQVP